MLPRRYASMQVLEAVEGQQAFRRTGHRAVFNYVPEEGYIYVRSRAISSRCNDNFDAFPAEEIEKAYRTFIGKPVFVNHHNEDHKRMRGVIIDAALHKDRNPDGTPDTWTEVLMKIDAHTFPKLGKAILSGAINRTSMGTDVETSECSICGNVAATPMQYCAHIPAKKGQRIYTLDPVTGKREGKLCYEICRGLSFFENSVLVEPPADPTAHFLGKVELGPGVTAHLAKTASTPAPVQKLAEGHTVWPVWVHATNRASGRTQRVLESKGMCEDHMAKLKGQMQAHNADLSIPYTLSLHHDTWPVEPGSEPCHSCIKNDVDSAFRHATLAARTAAVTTEPILTREQIAATTGSLKVWQLLIEEAEDIRREARTDARRPLKPLVPAKPVTEMNEDEKSDWSAQRKAHAQEWHKRNPVNHRNIVDHWNAATDDEREAGMNWYKDAHHTAAMISRDTQTPLHVVAGLVSNYSPQTHWATNIITAAKSARLKTALGGKGNKDKDWGLDKEGRPKPDPQGIHASGQQREVAEKLLTGTHDEDETASRGMHYSQLLKGPKTKAFAHLIHHGDDPHAVVVDRHALSVAAGARAADHHYEHSGLGGKKRYAEVAGHYQKAAEHISKQVGYTVHPHQVQAATWLVRQRLNEAGDRDSINKGSRSAEAAKSSMAELSQYMGEHHPEVEAQMPGTGYSERKSASLQTVGYGEVKAPPAVDTLRDEACPICGNADIMQGRDCAVCGYIQPPAPLNDPDVEKAHKLDDLRQNVQDQLLEADPSRNGAPFDDTTGQVNTVGCEACGAEFPAGQPETKPDAPEDQDETDGPAEGDPCPECNKGVLVAAGPQPDVDGDGLPDDEEVPADDDQSGNDDPEGGDEDDEDTASVGGKKAPKDDDSEEDEDAGPASKKKQARKYRKPHDEGTQVVMAPQNQNPPQQQRRAVLSAVAAQQELLDALAARTARLESQNQRLIAGFTVLATSASEEVLGRVKVAMIQKRADEQNPAQPIPEPAPEPATQSTQEALVPEAFADVTAPGMVPGTTNDVAADAVTTAYTPGQDIGVSPLTQLVDVTRPVDGTQGPRPLSEVKTEVDVRVGNPMNPQTAFPLGGPFAEAQRTASADDTGDSRFAAAMRLARLQIEAGVESGDDLDVAMKISAQASLEQIEHEIATATKFVKAASVRRVSTPPQGVVPRAPQGVQRVVPQMSTQAGLFQPGRVSPSVDDDCASIFL